MKMYGFDCFSELVMGRGGTALGLMPFYHAYGLGLMLMALSQDTQLVVMHKFSIEAFTSTVKKYKVNMKQY